MTVAAFWRTARSESRFQLRMMTRDPVSIVLAISTPLLNLPLLYAINRNTTVQVLDVLGQSTADAGVRLATQRGTTEVVTFGQYLTPALATFAVAGACMFGLAVQTVAAREDGVLKRIRSTPISPAGFLAGHVVTAVALAVVVVVATFAMGVTLYDATVVTRLLPAAFVTLLAGVACFAALGMACATLAPTRDAAIAATFALLVTLGFVSSTFFSPDIAPPWMRDISGWLPLEPFATALFEAVSPTTEGLGIDGPRIARLLGWATAGALVSIRFFSWEPSRQR